MAEGNAGATGPPWLFLVIGGAVGVALGVVVAMTTDIPLAPEAGLVIGVAAGWGMRRMRG